MKCKEGDEISVANICHSSIISCIDEYSHGSVSIAASAAVGFLVRRGGMMGAFVCESSDVESASGRRMHLT